MQWKIFEAYQAFNCVFLVFSIYNKMPQNAKCRDTEIMENIISTRVQLMFQDVLYGGEVTDN